jgi:DNA-binding transcriptional MerR regulator
VQNMITNNKEAEELSRIGEVADEFSVTLRTLRFYEDKGLINPKRVGTSRFYGRREKARLRLILLGREMLNLYEPKSGNKAQLRVALEKAAMQLERLNEQRKSVDEAIARLNQTMEVARKQIAETN